MLDRAGRHSRHSGNATVRTLAAATAVLFPLFGFCVGAQATGLGSALVSWSDMSSQATTTPVAIFGNDDRRSVPARYRKLSKSIGLLYNSRARTLCTAFCVAPDVAATAAHCLFRKTAGGRQPLSEFWFELRSTQPQRQSQIEGAARGVGMQNIVAGTIDLSVRPPIDAANDWALMRLSQPICRGHEMTIAGKPRLNAIRQSRRPQDRRNVFQISYHRDYEHWRLAYSSPCSVGSEYEGLSRSQIRREFTNPDRLVLHDCDTAGASSGSPILMETDRGVVVVGINVGTYVQSRIPVRTSRGATGTDSKTIANTGVSALAFSDLIGTIANARILSGRHDLRRVQQRLRELGHYNSAVDGIYGSRTRRAILHFEASEGRQLTGLPSRDLAGALGAHPPAPFRRGTRIVQPDAPSSGYANPRPADLLGLTTAN